jgi:hypothetical protein
MTGMPRFTAQWDGDCDAMMSPDCTGEITEGERAGYIDDEPACEACCVFVREQRLIDARAKAAERRR